ncbi:MAG: ATP-dependent DNA ligase, partial [Methyloceanibacter sp.]
YPEVVSFLKALPPKCFVVDGELAISLDGTLSFDALQQRIHPAESRIKKLSVETPAILILFDMLLGPKNKSLIEAPLTTRREALESFYKAAGDTENLKLSPSTSEDEGARRWLEEARGSLDGVIAKLLDGAYLPGERAMLKVKRLRTADCVVGGFRYAAGSRLVGSLLLGLYDAEGELDHVGFTATITNAERPALTKVLEALAAEPGFSGKAPGGPSRWSTERTGEWEPVQPKLVVEVRYDHVTGDRFRHGTKLVRFRPDKAPRQCTFEQLRPASAPETVEEVLG